MYLFVKNRLRPVIKNVNNENALAACMTRIMASAYSGINYQNLGLR